MVLSCVMPHPCHNNLAAVLERPPQTMVYGGMTMDKNFPFQKFLKNDENEPLHIPPFLSHEQEPEAPPTAVHKRKSAKDTTFSLLNLQETTDDLEDKATSQYLGHVHSQPKTTVIDKNKTFDNFIVGSSNSLVFTTAHSIAEKSISSSKAPSLYIYSNSGLGKTHLLHAVANESIRRAPHTKVSLLSARDFMKEMIDAMRNKNISSFQSKFTDKTDILMIDDIHELKNKEGTQNEFFHIFNELHDKGKRLLFTSDKPPSDIDGIEERIKTRLQWGLVLDIQKPDFETRMAIIGQKAQEFDLFLQEDVTNLIAASSTSSIRELEGYLMKLATYSQIMNVEIDAELTKSLLPIKSDAPEGVSTIESIAKAISSHYKIPLADLRSRTRGKKITLARHIGMYLSRKLTTSTHREIGFFYGNRDHTSVLHATNKVEEFIQKSAQIAKDISQIEGAIRS